VAVQFPPYETLFTAKRKIQINKNNPIIENLTNKNIPQPFVSSKYWVEVQSQRLAGKRDGQLHLKPMVEHVPVLHMSDDVQTDS